jgi:autotransporter-associated beta strand protein
MKNRMVRLLGVAILLSTISISPGQVTGKWDLATGFWSDRVTPSIGATNDLAILAGNLAGGRTITNDTSVSLGAMHIGNNNNNARAVNVRPVPGATITFTNLAGGAAWLVKTNNTGATATATDTIFTPIVLGADLSVSNRSTYGGLAIAGEISEVGGSRALYVGSSIAGNLGVTLSGANTFSGGVLLGAGILKLGNANALGTGALTMNGGVLGTSADLSGGLGVTNSVSLAVNSTVSNANALQLSGTIGGAFSLAKWGAAALTLSGSNSFSGGSSLRAGTLLLGNVDALGTGALTINGGVLGASTALAAGTGVTNAIVLGAAGIVSNVNALQLSGNISGGFSLTKKAAGTLTLSGVNTFGGPVVVSNGTAIFARQVSLYDNTQASWTEANIIVATGATLGLNVGGAGEFTSSDVQTIAALGTGSGGFANGSFLALDTTGGDFVHGSAIANPNAGANVLGLIKLGANTLTLGAANTYTGGTTVNNGTLRLGIDEALADTGVLTVNNGGTFDLNGNDETVWYLAGTAGGVITNSGAMADLILDLQNCNNRSASMDIRGDLRLVVKNSETIRSATTANQDYQQLNGTNTFTGGVVIDAGALRANNDLALGAVPGAFDADAVILKNGGALLGTATYDLEIHPNRGIFLESGTGILWTAFNSTPRIMTVHSQISGPGDLLVTGDSKLLLMRDSIYEGLTIVTQATLRVGHDLALSTNAVVLGTGATLTTVSNAPRTLANAIVLSNNVSLGATTIHNGTLTLTGGVDLGAANRTLSVYSQVEISGTVSNGGLARAQTGTLTLSGSNTYELGTTLGDSSGRLRVGNDDALGLGTVTMGRTTLTATGGVARVLTNHFVLTSNPTFGATAIDNGALELNSINLGVASRNMTNLSALTVSGVVSNGHYIKYGAGVLTLAGANTFTNFTIGANAGAVALAADNVLGVGTIDFVSTVGAIQSSDGSARTITNSVTLSSGSTTWGAVGTGDLTFDGAAWNNGAAAKTLFVSNSLTTINAPWTNNNVSVTKLGPGILAYGSTLAGSNWIVNGGTLRLDAGGGMTNVAAAVTLGPDGIFDVAAKSGWQMLGQQVLRGNGSVVGDVLSADGVRLIAGATGTVGTLTFANNLTLTSGTTNLFDLGTLTGAGGGTNDLIAVGGNLTAGSARIVVNPLQPLTTGTAYTLMTYGGTLSGSFGGVDVPNTRYTGVLSEGGGVIDATFSGAPLALTWSGSAAAGVAGSTWDLNNNANWAAGAEKFFTMDSVTFDESSPSGTVTLAGAIQPQSILVTGASNYTFAGSGKITASTGIQKTGPGTLTVSTVNDFDGDVLVAGGVFKLGVVGALGSAVGSTIVTNGGTLDLNNKRYDNTAEAFIVSGAGVGGTGAVVNTGADLTNQGVGYMRLAGDTTLGGPRRFDIMGTLDGGTYTLTKMGGGNLGIQAANVSVGAVVIDGGQLTIFNSVGLGDTAFNTTLNNAAHLRLYAPAGASFATEEPVVLTSGGTISIGGAASTTGTLSGPIDVQAGLLSNDVATVGYMLGAISGTGAFIKTGTGISTLGGTNTYSGATTIANGVLALGPYGSISNTPSIAIANGKLFDVSQVSGGWTLYDHQTLSGAASIAGNVTALGTLRPGASPGTMTYSNDLTLSDADLEFELASIGTVGGGVNDLIEVLGDLTALGTNAIAVTPVAGLAPQYTLFTYGGTLTGAATNFSVALNAPAMRPSYTLGVSDATAGEIRLTVANSFSNVLWSAGNGTWDTTNTVAWNANTEMFYQGDAVVFDDSGAAGASTDVTVADRVAPNGITVSSAVDYVLGGAGHIGGDTWLVKEGAGRLTVSMTNAFTGDVWVNDGILRLGVSNGTALGTSAGKVYVTNGLGTLDLNRGTMVGKEVVIAGAGFNGLGAIVNSGGVARHGLRLLTLAGDATVGGTGNIYLGDGGSVLSTGGQAFDLTKIGNNTFYLNTTLVDPALADIFVEGGTLRYENALANGLGDATRTVYLASNTTFSMYRASLGLDKRFVAAGGSTINTADGQADWLQGNGLTNTLRGTIILTNGAVTFNAVTGMRVVGTVEGPGEMVKIGAGDLWLTGTNTFTGATTIKNGRILLGSNGQFTATSGISVQAGSLVLLNDRVVFQDRIGDTVPVVLAGGALVMRGKTGAGAVSETAGILSSGIGTTGVIDLWNGTSAGVDSVNLYFSGYDPGLGVINVFATNGVGVLGAGATNTANPHLYLTGLSDGIVPRMLVATTNFARYSTLNGVSAAIPTASFNGVADQTGVDTWFTAVRAGESDALDASRSISTLTITSPGTTRTNLNLAGFNLDAGGIWLNGANRFAITDTVGGGSLSGANLQFRLMNSTMLVSAVIGGAGNLDVSGANLLLILAGDNTYAGDTRISNGTLQIGDGGTAGTLGGGDVLNGGQLMFNRSDALAVGNVISGPGSLTKTGAGTLTFNAANLYTGSTTVRQGVVTLGLSDALPTGTALVLGQTTTAGALDLGAYDQTIGSLTVASTGASVTNAITIGAGKTLTVAGNVAVGVNVDNSAANLTVSGGGTLAVTTNGGTFRTSLVSGTDKSGRTTVDFSGLGAFLMDLGTGAMTVSAIGDNNANDRSVMILSASNVLRAAAITVGASGIGAINQLRLGSGTNILYVDALNLGTVGRDCGLLTFDGATGGIVLRDSSGAGRANVAIGTNANGTGYVAGNTLDVTGHEADLLIGTLRMGEYLNRGGRWTNTFSFNQGILDISSVEMSTACKAGVVGNSYLNIGGGLANLGSVSLSASIATGTLAITGGTVTLGGDIVKQAGGRGVLTLDGGTLDMQGNAIGSAGAKIDVVGLYAGTLRSVSEINGGDPITKTTAGTLTIEGANAYAGNLTVAAGTLKYNGTYTGGGLITVQGGATLMGTGSLAAVTVEAGGALNPGNSAGTLTVGSLTLDGGTTLEYDLGTSSDLILAGTTILGGIDFDNFTFLPGVGFGPGVYTLINATSISGLGAGTTGTVGSYDAALSIDDDGQDLVLTVIPEPTTLGMLGLCAAAALLRRRLRRQG